MKKNLLFILSIVFFGLSFASCGDDDNDEDGDGNKSNVSQFVGSRDYSKYETYYTTEEEATYKNGRLNISFDFGTKRVAIGDEAYIEAFYNLLFKFTADISKLKVGDELQMMLADENDIEFTDYITLLDVHDNYINGGKIIVKSIDTENKKISIEFQNLDIWRNPRNIHGDIFEEEKEFMIKSGILEFIYK